MDETKLNEFDEIIQNIIMNIVQQYYGNEMIITLKCECGKTHITTYNTEVAGRFRCDCGQYIRYSVTPSRN